jgi:hypothetical protein
MKKLLILTTAVALTTACLNHHDRHVFYLDPDGSVAWTVVQTEIRSNAETEPDRVREEREFLDSVDRGEHPVARALDQLGALWVDTQLVRDERPYTVVTEARFESVARALGEFFHRLDLVAETRLEAEDGLMRLSFCYREGQGHTAGSDNELVEALLADHEAYRFVLTEGKFLEAEGFRLEADGTAAVLLDLSENDDGTATHSLTWPR